MSYYDTDQASKGKFPERKFFWGVMFTTRKTLADSLVNEIAEKKLMVRQDVEEASKSV